MNKLEQARDALEAGNRKEAWEIIDELLMYYPENLEALELRLEMAVTDSERRDAEQRLMMARRKAKPNVADKGDQDATLSRSGGVVITHRDYLSPALLTALVYVLGSALAGIAVNWYFLDQAGKERASGVQIEHYGCLQWLIGAGVVYLIFLLAAVCSRIAN